MSAAHSCDAVSVQKSLTPLSKHIMGTFIIGRELKKNQSKGSNIRWIETLTLVVPGLTGKLGSQQREEKAPELFSFTLSSYITFVPWVNFISLVT